MNKLPLPRLLLLISLLSSSAPSTRAQALPRGEDVVDIPAVQSGLYLHSLFQSNMVLQRDKPLRIWGWADAGSSVQVQVASKTLTAQADSSGRWEIEAPAMSANSTPQTLRVTSGQKSITLENVLIGDVWVLGGQSNMEHPLARVEDGDLEILSAHFPNLRHLTVPSPNGPEYRINFPRLMEWHGFFNTHYRKGYWELTSPESVRELSAIGYIFAKRLHLASGVPIGVIDLSRGGTCVETWIPLARLQQMETPEVQSLLAEWDRKIADYDPANDLEDQQKRYRQRVASMKASGKELPADWKEPTQPRPGPAFDMNRPGNCYASMMAPVAGLQVKGVIWHQGFNNAMQPNGHVLYYQVFDDLITSWREAFDDPEMPFGIISLCTNGPPQTEDNYLEMMIDEGIYLREVQYQTFRDFQQAGDQQIGFTSSYDMRRSWYHPQLKIPVGERAARWALATQYGQTRMKWEPPTIGQVQPDNGALHLTFNQPVGCQKDEEIEGFAIAGEDRRFQPAKAEYLVVGKDAKGRPQVNDKVLVLTSPHVKTPVHFRYAWGRNPMGNLKNRYTQDGPPLATQRSDTWPMNEVPVHFGDTIDRAVQNQARQTMKLFDLDRRVKDAQLTLEELHAPTSKAMQEWEEKWGQ